MQLGLAVRLILHWDWLLAVSASSKFSLADVTCMEIRMTGLCDVDLWLTALKPASLKLELLGFFLPSLFFPKEISQTFPSAPLSEAQSKEIRKNKANLYAFFLHFLCLLSVPYQDFALPSNARTALHPFSLPGPSKERLSVWSPLGPTLLPQTLPSGSAPPNSNCPFSSQDPGASHNDQSPV